MIRPSFQTYFRPLFWACLLSVPLHSIKRRLLKGFQAGLENGGLFNAFIAGFIRRPFEILLGPFADVVFAVLESYLNAVKFISHVGNMEPMNTLQSAATDSSKTISNSQNRHCKVSSKTRSETRVDDDNDAEYQDESDPDSLPSSASDNEINRSSTASFSTPVPTKRRHGYNMRDSPRFITKIHRSGTPTSRTRGTPSAAARIGLNGSGITPISSPIYHHHHQNHHLLSHHKKIRFVHRKILNEPILEPFRRLTRRWAKGLKKRESTSLRKFIFV